MYSFILRSRVLWERFYIYIYDDFTYRLREFLSVLNISNPDLDYGLYLIEKDLFKINKVLYIFDLSVLVYNWSSYNVNPLISYKLDYDETAE